MSDPSERLVPVGVVTRPQGLRGAVRVKSFNPTTGLFAPGAKLRVSLASAPATAAKPAAKLAPSEAKPRPRGKPAPSGAKPPAAPQTLVVTSAKPANAPGLWLVTFEGVSTVAAAEALRDATLSVPRASLPPLAAGEFYHCDLPGYAALDERGAVLGEVREVLTYPTCDALLIATRDGGELEVPVVDGLVLRIDSALRVVHVATQALASDDDAGPAEADDAEADEPAAPYAAAPRAQRPALTPRATGRSRRR